MSPSKGSATRFVNSSSVMLEPKFVKNASMDMLVMLFAMKFGLYESRPSSAKRPLKKAMLSKFATPTTLLAPCSTKVLYCSLFYNIV